MMRIRDLLKQWKLSPMDLESRRRWEHYTEAKEIMLPRREYNPVYFRHPVPADMYVPAVY